MTSVSARFVALRRLEEGGLADPRCAGKRHAGERGGRRPRSAEATDVDEAVGQQRPDREPAVEEQREATEVLGAALDGSEVGGDRRTRGVEARAGDALEHPQRDDRRDGVGEREAGARQEQDHRRGHEERQAAAAVGLATDHGAQRQRRDAERADGQADRGARRAQLVGQVQGERYEEHAQRQELEQRGRAQEPEPAVHAGAVGRRA